MNVIEIGFKSFKDPSKLIYSSLVEYPERDDLISVIKKHAVNHLISKQSFILVKLQKLECNSDFDFYIDKEFNQMYLTAEIDRLNTLIDSVNSCSKFEDLKLVETLYVVIREVLKR